MNSAGGSQIKVHTETKGDRGDVARVIISNEKKLNTLNTPLMEELIATLRSLAAQATLRAVVLEGAGPTAFIAGANIDELKAFDVARGRAYITLLHRVCTAVRDLPVPVIAKLHGYTIGGGLEIAVSCDLRAASTEAKFAMPEVKLGLPSVIEAALIPRLVGWGRAREIMLLGEVFSAADAARWGLVERLVEPGQLDAAVNQWVESIVAAEPRAVRMQKALMRKWEDMPLRAAIETGIDCFAEAWEDEPPYEAIRHFVAAEATRKAARTRRTA